MSVGTALMFASSLMAQTVEKNVVQPDTSIWTLDRCIDYAMTHATDIRKKVVEADNARQDRGAALGGFMPSVSANVGAQFSWGRNVDPETNTYNTITTFNNSYSVGGSLTLFDGAQTWNAFRKARLAVRRSDNDLAIAKDEKAIEVMERYVDAVYNEAALRIAEDKLADSRSLLEKTRRMEELGEKSYPDVAQIEAQVADDEYQVEHQRTTMEKARTMTEIMACFITYNFNGYTILYCKMRAKPSAPIWKNTNGEGFLMYPHHIPVYSVFRVFISSFKPAISLRSSASSVAISLKR